MKQSERELLNRIVNRQREITGQVRNDIETNQPPDDINLVEFEVKPLPTLEQVLAEAERLKREGKA